MPYVREKKVPGKNGKVYRYFQLVEGKRVNGKVRQRVVAHLGKHDSIEDARAAAASVVPKEDREQKKRYWVVVPHRAGFTWVQGRLKPMYPVFLSKEAAQSYGGAVSSRGGSEVEYKILGLDGPELAAALRGVPLGANHIAIWGTDFNKQRQGQQEPEEILTRRTFVKRLGRGDT